MVYVLFLLLVPGVVQVLQDETGVAASMLPAMDDSVDDDADEEDGNHARGLDIEEGNQARSPCLC